MCQQLEHYERLHHEHIIYYDYAIGQSIYVTYATNGA